MNRNRIILYASIAIVVIILGSVGWRYRPYNFHGMVMKSAELAPNFTLTSSRTGEPVNLRDFKGKIVLLYFGYTSCPDVCPASLSDVAQALEDGWSSEGMDVRFSSEVLARFLGVQNTYISAFQSLGALGLLLGTFGLAAVQLRSVLERKREFALMQAVGFAPNRIAGIRQFNRFIGENRKGHSGGDQCVSVAKQSAPSIANSFASFKSGGSALAGVNVTLTSCP